MVQVLKKIHFFRLDMYTKSLNSSGEEVQRNFTVEERKRIMNVLTRERLNESKSVKIHQVPNDISTDYAVMEVLSEKENYVFGKLGKETDINTYQFRDEATLKSEALVRKVDQFFESFTYFIINLDNFSVAYLQESSAPSISYLERLITSQFQLSHEAWGKITALMDPNALALISGKDVIGSITYNMTIPADAAIEITGLSESDYELLQNQKEMVVTVSLKAKARKQSVFMDKINALNFFSRIGEGKNKVVINAKDDDEPFMQQYRLIDNPLVKKVKLEFHSDTTVHSDYSKELEQKLWELCERHKIEIENYIGFNDE